MTEDKAKEILNFLAKKYGYAGFDYFDETADSKIIDSNASRHLELVYCVAVKDESKEVNSLDCLFRKTKRQMSYKSVLEFMLDTISAGYNIGAFFHKYGDYMLRSHTTLEEILVDMDLNKIEEKNECGELQ